MMTTYEEYLDMEKTLTFEDMQDIHRQMIADIGTDADAVGLYVELFDASTKYADMRAKWRDRLGDEKDDPYNRKRIGDFACYLVFINSLNAR